jgi:hypothetical protein
VEPIGPRLNGSMLAIATARRPQVASRRSTAAISQFCDSQALKSKSLRRW